VLSIALARADARVWCRPRQEAGLITRIAATVASRPPGSAQQAGRRSRPEPAGAAEGAASEGRTTGPATRSGNPAKRAHNLHPPVNTGGWNSPAIYPAPALPATPWNTRPRLI